MTDEDSDGTLTTVPTEPLSRNRPDAPFPEPLGMVGVSRYLRPLGLGVICRVVVDYKFTTDVLITIPFYHPFKPDPQGSLFPKTFKDIY